MDIVQTATEVTDTLQIKFHGPFESGFPGSCPGLAREPTDQQYRALATIEWAAQSDEKSICIADPPGLGKQLPAMMAAVKAAESADQFSIVVVPSTCVNQWYEEFQDSFTFVSFTIGNTFRICLYAD